MTRSLGIALTLLLLGNTSLAVAQAANDRLAQGTEGQAAKPNSSPDQNAKQEPSAKAKSEPHPGPGIFVDGMLAVPGAAADSQTRPAKFSADNDARDKIPIMARGPSLTDDQKKMIAETLRQSPTSSARVEAAPATALPVTVDLQEWPARVRDQIPAIAGTKYVHFADRILIVTPANRIVIGEIAP